MVWPSFVVVCLFVLCWNEVYRKNEMKNSSMVLEVISKLNKNLTPLQCTDNFKCK